MNDTGAKTLLLVEDEPVIALTEARMLQRNGYRVITAQTGEEAVEAALSSPGIDLVLMDINLGNGLDGSQAAELILKQRELPIMFLSSHTERAVVEKTEGITSYGYMVKGSGETVITASIKMAFRLFEARQKEQEKERKLRESEGRFASAFEFASIGMALVAPEGRWLKVNRALCSILGYAQEELLTSDFQHITHPDDLEADMNNVRALLRGDIDTYQMQKRYFHKTGKIIWALLSVSLIRDEHNFPLHFISQVVNITEHMHIGVALRERDDLYHTVLHTAMDGFWMASPQGNLLEVNETYAQMSGYSQQELVGMNISVLDIYESQADVEARIQRVIAHGQDRFVTRHRRKDGSTYAVEASIKYLNENGGCTVGFMRDIEERVQVEETLRASRERYQHISKLTSDIAYSCAGMQASAMHLDWISGAVQAITGYSEAEMIALGCWGHLVTEEDLPLFKKFVSGLASGEKGTCEVRIRRKDGEIRWLLSKAECVEEVGAVQSRRLFGGLIDISRRKQVEAAYARANILLQQQKKSLAVLNKVITLANHGPDLASLLDTILGETIDLLDYDSGGIYRVDADRQHARVVCSRNVPDGFLEKVGVVDITRAPFYDLFSNAIPLITEHLEEIAPERAAQTGFCSVISMPLISHEMVIGSITLASKRRFLVTEDERETLLSIMQELGNIIERLTAESEAKNSAHNLEALFNTIEEMVFLLDMQGNILHVNDTVCKKLQYTRAELIDNNVLFVHIPERREEVLQVVQDLIAGAIDACLIPLQAKDGTRIEVESRVTHGWWNNREVLIGVAHDVTARKRAEEALKRAYQEKHDLLQELQHRAKNSFATIASMIALMHEANPASEAKLALSEISARVRAIAELYTLLYTSEAINDVPLETYFTRIAIACPVAGNIDFRQDYEPVSVHSRVAAPLGLVLNELITNAIKYAFPNYRSGTITVSLSRVEDRAVLRVEDDGAGLPPSFNLDSCDSLGLRIVQALVQQVQGHFQIGPGPGAAGTLCVVEFPVQV